MRGNCGAIESRLKSPESRALTVRPQCHMGLGGLKKLDLGTDHLNV